MGSQTSSMSPVGPYSAGQVVTVTYTLSSFTQLNSNWIIAFDIDLGIGWASISPVSAPGNPGGSGGSWVWDVQNTYPNGLNFGPGYRFQNNGNSDYGTSSNGPFTLSFELVVGSSCQDLSIDLSVLGDCQTGGWNGGGCCVDPAYSIYNGSSSLSINYINNNITCNGLSDGSISLTPTGGVSPYTYLWSNGTTTASVNNLLSGNYNVTVTDAVGCSEILNNITIIEPSILQSSYLFTDITCNGFSDGSISITPTGGVSPYTYLWSNGATTGLINNLLSGSYNVTVTDAVGCTEILNNLAIIEPSILQSSYLVNNITCNGFSDGSISINPTGGVSPYTFLWSSGATTASINNLLSGNYNVTVTDAVGCTSVLTNFSIVEPPAITTTVVTFNVSCNGFSDGSVMLNSASNIISYLWSDGQTTQNAINLIAGTYSYTITDDNGCSFFDSVTVYEPNPLVVILNTIDETCFGSSDGIASIDLQGSSNPSGTFSTLSYCASNPSPNLVGPYTNIEEVQLIGDNNDIYNNTSNAIDFYEDYSAFMYADITEGLTYSLNVAINDMSGTGSYSGGVRVFIDFNIDGDFTDIGEDIGIISSPAQLGTLIPISFTVPNTGFYGPTRMRIVCQDQNSITSSNDIGPCDSPTGFNLPYFGATEDYSIVLNNPNVSATYLWSTGQTNDSINGLSSGSYSVSITDDNGCLTIENFTISSFLLITVSADLDQFQCQGVIPNSLSALGSTSGNNYSWSPSSNFINSNIQNPVFSSSLNATTTFTVSFTDLNGCVGTDDVIITVYPNIITPPINHN